MKSEQRSQQRAVQAIPLIMLGIFCLFWTSVNILHGQYLFTIPSALILAAVAVRLVLKRRGVGP